MKWEYFSIVNQTRLTDEAMNVLGKDDWELASVILDRPSGWIYHFKRQAKLHLKGKPS